jgi:hypothetical protein
MAESEQPGVGDQDNTTFEDGRTYSSISSQEGRRLNL